MQCKRIIGERHRYWNIKGWGHFVVAFFLNYSRFMRFERYHFEQIVVPPRYHSCRGVFRRLENHFWQISIMALSAPSRCF